MKAHAITQPARATARAGVWTELLARQRTLSLFAAALLLSMLPTALACAWDDTLLRGVSIWIKPLKFQASIALFALSTAWFVGLLPEARRRAPAVRALVATLVVAGTLEIAYIVLRAAQGQASHYNGSSALHVLAYLLMGAGALAMMATQLVLAWQIHRHGRRDLPELWRHAVVLGLVLTFALGVGAAAPLSSAQPPDGAGWPLLGWHLGGGDLRPAHFVGSHAQQLIPLAGWVLAHRGGLAPVHARVALALGALAYVALWGALLALGLSGARWAPPGVA